MLLDGFMTFGFVVVLLMNDLSLSDKEIEHDKYKFLLFFQLTCEDHGQFVQPINPLDLIYHIDLIHVSEY